MPMETSVSGFKVRGPWSEIVDHGRRVTQAIQEVQARTGEDGLSEDLAAWDRWRPKQGETLEEEISEKTANHATIEEGEGEQAGVSPGEDLAAARRRLAEAGGHLAQGTFDEVMRSIGRSVGRASRAADSAGRKAFRSVEDAVYKRIMTSMSPYYFDSQAVSAVLRKATSEEGTFVLEVNVNDDDLKEAVAEKLEDEAWRAEADDRRDPAEA